MDELSIQQARSRIFGRLLFVIVYNFIIYFNVNKVSNLVILTWMQEHSLRLGVDDFNKQQAFYCQVGHVDDVDEIKTTALQLSQLTFFFYCIITLVKTLSLFRCVPLMLHRPSRSTRVQIAALFLTVTINMIENFFIFLGIFLAANHYLAPLNHHAVYHALAKACANENNISLTSCCDTREELENGLSDCITDTLTFLSQLPPAMIAIVLMIGCSLLDTITSFSGRYSFFDLDNNQEKSTEVKKTV